MISKVIDSWVYDVQYFNTNPTISVTFHRQIESIIWVQSLISIGKSTGTITVTPKQTDQSDGRVGKKLDVVNIQGQGKTLDVGLIHGATYSYQAPSPFKKRARNKSRAQPYMFPNEQEQKRNFKNSSKINVIEITDFKHVTFFRLIKVSGPIL